MVVPLQQQRVPVAVAQDALGYPRVRIRTDALTRPRVCLSEGVCVLLEYGCFRAFCRRILDA